MGFKKPNHTQTPNELFTMMRDMTEAELKVTLYAVRVILGYHRVKPYPISYNDFIMGTGLKRAAVSTGIKAALKRGILRVAHTGKRKSHFYEMVFEDDDQSEIQTSQDDDQSEIQTSNGSEFKPVVSTDLNVIKENIKEKDSRAASNSDLSTDENKLAKQFIGIWAKSFLTVTDGSHIPQNMTLAQELVRKAVDLKGWADFIRDCKKDPYWQSKTLTFRYAANLYFTKQSPKAIEIDPEKERSMRQEQDKFDALVRERYMTVPRANWGQYDTSMQSVLNIYHQLNRLREPNSVNYEGDKS